MNNKTGRDSDKFMLRLPAGMRDRIKVVAEGNGRSMNAEIIGTLQEAYPDYGAYSDRVTRATIAAMAIVEEHGLDPKSDEYSEIIALVVGKYLRHIEKPMSLHRTRDEEFDF